MRNIRRLQDIQIGNVDLIGTYRDTFNNDSIETAQGLINTDTLKSYVLQSEWMNDTKEKIEDLEEYKVTECDDVFVDETEQFQFYVDEFLYVDEYDSSTQYYKNNFVVYEDEIYFCLKNSLGNLPTDTTYWLKVGLKGEKGQYSLGVVYQGFWNSSLQYYKYDLISYNNKLYIAKKDNINVNPEYKGTQEEGFLYLNDSLFLNNTVYLTDFDNPWFLLAQPDELSKIYDTPEDYNQLSARSIFFQKL